MAWGLVPAINGHDIEREGRQGERVMGVPVAIVRALTTFEGLSACGQSIESCQGPDNRLKESVMRGGQLTVRGSARYRLVELNAAAPLGAHAFANALRRRAGRLSVWGAYHIILPGPAFSTRDVPRVDSLAEVTHSVGNKGHAAVEGWRLLGRSYPTASASPIRRSGREWRRYG